MQEAALSYFVSLSHDRRTSYLSQLGEVITTHATEFVGLFYDTFLKDAEATAFLSQSMVHSRLSGSLRDWLLALVAIDCSGDGLAAFEDRQKMIGEIHARIKIPVHLVLEGASLLKKGISQKLMIEHPGPDIPSSITLINELVDYAMLHMSKAYVKGTAERVQVDEAYRLFSLGQDVGLERETQKATLMEWSQTILFEIVANHTSIQIDPLANSSFGLWIRHRAAVMFEGSIMLNRIERAISEIDEDLLPKIQNDNDRSSAVSRLQVLIEEIKFLLNDLFQSLSAAANARDPLTSALTRRFLPSVLGREVTVANQQDSPLTLLMIDVDFFKKINDTWGHSAGDYVLRQMAETVMSTTRTSDYVFRYGGEEFLVVLVETDRDEGYRVAERIRTSFESKDLQVGDGKTTRATLSIGLAVHDGHPDFQRLIDAADHALYDAKSGGRNQTKAA
ncbi:GGDEF domain-containing protein [Pseudorhizobium flavum]|uniref:GGDEF domain-containing protein n=1 Tax=Pseudorhizobium flavum TaxID=1335061 RepID=UPI00376F554D